MVLRAFEQRQFKYLAPRSGISVADEPAAPVVTRTVGLTACRPQTENPRDQIAIPGERPMSGPIVRTGTTPKFWENWDRVFGADKAEDSTKKKTKAKARKKSAKSRKK